jgi:quercetin 2,3-dioxygenase
MYSKIIRSAERGFYNHGWLKTYHTFSFGDYYNPDSMNFGVLRVLNDEIIESGSGFGLNPHSNMEVITILSSGILEHEDSTGEKGTIKQNEVQVISCRQEPAFCILKKMVG